MAREWETIICYEDRSTHLTTSRWRLAGVKTRQNAENTDGGVLWLETTRDGDTVTADLFQDPARQAADKVATGTADASGLDGTAANAAPVELSEANASGLTGCVYLHDYQGDGAAPVQVALCVDDDLAALWDGIADLPGYDASAGCAEFIRLAGEDVLAKVSAMFQDQLGGYAAAAAWFITDAARILPDLRRIANPAQLRSACAHRALEIGLGRSHRTGSETMYSRLRDYHRAEYERALGSVVLAIRRNHGGPAEAASAAAVRQSRV